MTAAVLERPSDLADWLAEHDDGPGEHHLYCCDPNRGLCGADIGGPDWEEADGDDSEDPICEDCERIDATGKPCGAPFCRSRRAMRAWRRGWSS